MKRFGGWAALNSTLACLLLLLTVGPLFKTLNSPRTALARPSTALVYRCYGSNFVRLQAVNVGTAGNTPQSLDSAAVTFEGDVPAEIRSILPSLDVPAGAASPAFTWDVPSPMHLVARRRRQVMTQRSQEVGTTRIAGQAGDEFHVDTIPLANVREAAKTWGSTIAGVFTLGGILTVLQGDTKAGQLTDGGQRLLVVLLVVALVLAVGAVITAFGVAFEPETTNSATLLNGSIIATVLALVCLALSTFVLWKGDQSPAAAQQYLVTYEASNTVACGTLTRDGAGTLVFSGGALTDVAEIVETEGCPK